MIVGKRENLKKKHKSKVSNLEVKHDKSFGKYKGIH